MLVFSACSVWRGIPTHGGGKRFDEEERAVTGSIRRAVADMKLDELKGKATQIIVDSIAHSGGGYQTFPGISSISANYSESEGLSDLIYAAPINPLIYSPFSDSHSNNNNTSKGISASASPMFSYNASTYPTDADATYLLAAINMKARHNGIKIVGASPQHILYVMVDVLGINRSRKSSLIFWKDDLSASCELTYYAVEATSGTLTFPARATHAKGNYQEASILGFSGYRTNRTLASLPPENFPVDGEPDPLAKITTPQTSGTTITQKAGAVLNKPVSTFLEERLHEADLQIQVGNFDNARRLIETVRGIDPNYPGLAEVESKLRQKSQRSLRKFLPSLSPILHRLF